MIQVVIFDEFNPAKRAYIGQLTFADQYQLGTSWYSVSDRDKWLHGQPVDAYRQPTGDHFRVGDEMQIQSLTTDTTYSVTIEALQMANVSELKPEEIADLSERHSIPLALAMRM